MNATNTLNATTVPFRDIPFIEGPACAPGALMGAWAAFSEAAQQLCASSFAQVALRWLRIAANIAGVVAVSSALLAALSAVMPLGWAVMINWFFCTLIHFGYLVLTPQGLQFLNDVAEGVNDLADGVVVTAKAVGKAYAAVTGWFK